MPNDIGTLERIAQALGNALSELSEVAQPANLALLLDEMGLTNAPDLTGHALLAQRLDDVVASATELPQRLEDLALAIDGDDRGAIASAGALVLVQCAAVAATLDAVATELRTALAGTAGGPDLADEFTKRVIADMIARYLDREHPLLRRVLTLAAVLDWDVVSPSLESTPPLVRRRFHLDRLPTLLSDPIALFEAGYGWGQNDFDASRLLRRIAEIFEALDPIATFGDVDGPPVPPVLEFGELTIAPAPSSPPGLAGELFIDVGQGTPFTLAQLSDRSRVVFTIGGDLAAGLTLRIVPPTTVTLTPPPAGTVTGQAAFEVVGQGADASHPLPLLSVLGATGIDANEVSAGLTAAGSWSAAAPDASLDLGARALIKGGRIVVSAAGGDGFLTAILPRDGMTLEFDLGIGWSSTKGLYIEGGAGLSIDIPANGRVGPILLSAVVVGARVESSTVALTTGVTARADLGPLTVVVRNVGIQSIVDFANAGNLGIADFSVAFKSPDAIGLSIDAGIVKGGGFVSIDPIRGEYSGSLELTFATFSLKAIAILTTKRPDGSEGWALVVMIYGQFPTPIQLSYGFTLSGVGGMLGVHHGCDRPQLEAGMRSGAFDAILFPRDPVGNAPTIIDRLRAIFPIRANALVVGPMLEIGWGTPNIIKVRLGLLVPIDNVFGGGRLAITQIIMLGQLEVRLPPGAEGDAALLQLVVDFLGYVDLQESVAGFVARLRDSRVAQVTLTGMLVVRFAWGTHKGLVLAAGGFHPRFTDLPPGLPAPIDRIGAGFSIGAIQVSITGYFAVTPATVQAGARVDAVAKLGSVQIKGFFGFDTIFYSEPTFHFEIDARCGFAVRWRGHSLASVSFKGTLTGPGRWHLVGHAEFSILWWSVDIDVDEAWGDPPPTPVLPGTNVMGLLLDDVRNHDCWSAQMPAGGAALVTLSARAGEDEALAHPLSKLSFTQRRVPLKLQLERFGRTSIIGDGRFDVTEVRVGGTRVEPSFSTEFFARSNFIELSNEEKLAQPSFEPFPAGIDVGRTSYSVAPDLAVPLDYETAYIDVDQPATKPPRDVIRFGLRFAHFVDHVSHADVSRSKLRIGERLRPASVANLRVSEAPLANAAVDTLGAAGAIDDAAARFSATLAKQASPLGTVVVEAFELAIS